MQDINLYMAELSIGTCKISSQIDKKISLAFRIGKNVVQSSHPKTIEEGIIQFNTILQLNTNKLALETQRCSLALTSQKENGQQIVIGLALINIPKDYKIHQKKYKLTQCADKFAEVEISLKIVSLQQNNNQSDKASSSRIKDSEISMRSIAEMKDFEREIISPPKLFTNRSQISQCSNHFFLSLPKPRENRQKSPNPLTLSICSQAIEEVRADSLQKECKCLKELLKLQIQKNKQANHLIRNLQQSLIQIRKDCDKKEQLQQTFLLEDLTKQQSESKIDLFQELNRKISQLSLKNQFLTIQNKELQDLILKLSDFTQQNMNVFTTQKLNHLDAKNNPRQLLKRLQNTQKLVAQWQKKFQRLKSQIYHLQQNLKLKQQQYQSFKKKMKIQQQFSSLRHIQLQKTISPTQAIKMMMQRQINQKKQMLKLLLRFTKLQSEAGNGIVQKIKMKVQKSFNTLSTRRLSKQLLMAQKGELLKCIELLNPKCLIQ